MEQIRAPWSLGKGGIRKGLPEVGGRLPARIQELQGSQGSLDPAMEITTRGEPQYWSLEEYFRKEIEDDEVLENVLEIWYKSMKKDEESSNDKCTKNREAMRTKYEKDKETDI